MVKVSKKKQMIDSDLEDRISVKELMGDGFKDDINKGLKKAGKVYRKNVRPVVTTAAKATLPVVKTAIKVALPAALAAVGVPPAAVAPLVALGTELATEGLKAGLNKSGVTEGLGIRTTMPVRRLMKPGMYHSGNLMGAGIDPLNAYDELTIATQMKSKPMAAVNQMNLQQVRVRPMEMAQHVNVLPTQMQSKTNMTGMNLTPAVTIRGQGLYPAGHRGHGLF